MKFEILARAHTNVMLGLLSCFCLQFDDPLFEFVTTTPH
jgi:hypothetical protein